MYVCKNMHIYIYIYIYIALQHGGGVLPFAWREKLVPKEEGERSDVNATKLILSYPNTRATTHASAADVRDGGGLRHSRLPLQPHAQPPEVLNSALIHEGPYLLLPSQHARVIQRSLLRMWCERPSATSVCNLTCMRP